MMQILAPNRRKLVASPAYLKYKGTPEQVSDLNKHSLITLESETNIMIGILGLTKQQRKPSRTRQSLPRQWRRYSENIS